MEWTQQRCFVLTCLFCYYGIKNATFQLCQLHKKQNYFETQRYTQEILMPVYYLKMIWLYYSNRKHPLEWYDCITVRESIH